MMELVKMWWMAWRMTGSRAAWTSGLSSITARMVSMVLRSPMAVMAFSSPASALSRT